MTQKLLSPIKIGSTELKNRVVMAPMTRSRAHADHTPSSLMVDYYAERASGGLLITEGTAPDPNGCGYPRIPGIWSETQVAEWRHVTEAVHAKGGKIAIQLMHTGRIGHALNLPEGARILAPSVVQAAGEMFTDEQGAQAHPEPEAMNGVEVEKAIEGFVHAADNAIRAGFDLVEIHGANGYLVDQFLAANTNQRTDEWGGGFPERARFALEVASRIASKIGADRTGIRLSPFGVFNGIESWDGLADDFVWLAGKLSDLKLAYLHVVDHSSMGAPSLGGEVKERMRAAFDGAFILSGGYDVDRAEQDLEDDKGELVAFGKPYISNPDLVERMTARAALNDPDFETFYTPGEKGYTDYPHLGAG